MEINPPRSKDHEQPRGSLTPELIDKIIQKDVEPLLRDDIDIPTYPLDITQVNNFMQEAYGHQGNATSAYIEVLPELSSLVVNYENEEHYTYTLYGSIPEGGAQAILSRRTVTHDNIEVILDEQDMEVADLVLYLRSLDSLSQK